MGDLILSSICLLIGFLLGKFFSDSISGLFEKTYNFVTTKIKIFILGVSIFITGITLIGGSFKLLNNNIVTVILNFFSSFVFAWILTEISSEKGFRQRQKDTSIRSYRHTIKMKEHIQYCISYVEMIIENGFKCSRLTDGECEATNYIYRLRDSLIYLEGEIEANIDDWGDDLAEDLENIEIIKKFKSDINNIEKEIEEIKQGEYYVDPKKKEECVQYRRNIIENKINKIEEIKTTLPKYMMSIINSKDVDKCDYKERLRVELRLRESHALKKDVLEDLNYFDSFIEKSEEV